MAQVPVQYRATRNPADGRAYVKDVLRLDFAHDDTGADLQLPIPATPDEPIWLQNVALIILEGFGSGKTIDLGDGSDPDAYVDQTDLDENVVGATAQSVGSANAKAQGEYLTAERRITVTLGGSPTVGQGFVLAEIFRLA